MQQCIIMEKLLIAPLRIHLPDWTVADIGDANLNRRVYAGAVVDWFFSEKLDLLCEQKVRN